MANQSIKILYPIKSIGFVGKILTGNPWVFTMRFPVSIFPSDSVKNPWSYHDGSCKKSFTPNHWLIQGKNCMSTQADLFKSYSWVMCPGLRQFCTHPLAKCHLLSTCLASNVARRSASLHFRWGHQTATPGCPNSANPKNRWKALEHG